MPLGVMLVIWYLLEFRGYLERQLLVYSESSNWVCGAGPNAVDFRSVIIIKNYSMRWGIVMTEVLFTLTIIFVAYVVYVIVNEQNVAVKHAEPEAKAQGAVEKIAVENIKSELIEKKIAVPKEPSRAAKKPVSTRAIPNTAKGGVRNPKTGEVATVTNNYRFTKRWIKEALVAEGLLDKIYKNNELDTATEATIKTALLKLEAMDQYRA